MNLKTGWLLALAVLAVLAMCGGIIWNSFAVSGKPTPAATVVIPPSSSFLLKAVSRAQQRKVFEEQMSRFRKTEAELRARIAKLPLVNDPAMQKNFTDLFMRKREPKYRQLFEAWDMDAYSVDEVLKVIRERESRIREALFTSMKDGDSTNYMGKKRKEERLAASKIMDLIGDDHYGEFAQMETEISNAESAEVRAKAGRHPRPLAPAAKP